MSLILLGFAGVLLGAAGVELLRAARPKLVKKIEDSAKHLVDSFNSSESNDEKEPKKE